ncbi:MAG: hypothetical protein COT17_06240 [Elusimicrobia bacterium CG08_land_8_20_14_0_20_51_18]|nr:MAG: hypothetical protein COT17_06240 [Elusimicrobia bacterium CG08_land_8_20_14_0_20_51_18]
MTNCPKCPSETLVKTSVLANIPLDICPGCSGIWFDKGELEELLKKSQGYNPKNLELINPKAEGLACPRCKTKMSHGGLVNPLLLVDKCQSCGGVWLDSRELDLLKKLLGVSGGPSEMKVDRPAEVPAAPQARDLRSSLIKLVSAACAVLGFVGVSFEIYLYYSPAETVSHTPSLGLTSAGALLFVGGILILLRRK